jgi:hypothetical protein
LRASWPSKRGDDVAQYPAVDLEHAAVLLAVGFVLAAANRRRAANSTPDDLATVSGGRAVSAVDQRQI